MIYLVVVGMPGSGKDVLAKAALEMGFRKVSMGDAVRRHAALSGLDAGDASIGGFADSQRKEHGPAVWADRTLERMPSGNVIIDGSRSMHEISRFREVLGSGLKVVAVDAPRDIRMGRLMKRGREDDPATAQDFDRRDARELSWGLGEAMSSADMVLDNSGGLEEFRMKCRAALARLLDEEDSRAEPRHGKSI